MEIETSILLMEAGADYAFAGSGDFRCFHPLTWGSITVTAVAPLSD